MNYYVVLPIALIVLFFVFIYRTDAKKNSGKVVISIALDKNNLSNEQRDSLITELLDVYDGMKNNSYHPVDIVLRGKTDKKIIVSKSIFNSLRSAFSASFYTYENRLTDIENFISKYSENSERFWSTVEYRGHLKEKNAEFIYFGNVDNSNSNEANSIAMVKTRIQECLKSKKIKKIIISAISNDVVDVDDVTNTEETSLAPGPITPTPNPSTRSKSPTNNEPDEKPVILSETSISFALEGNVNVFRFSNSAPGVTYNYEIKCESNCIGDDYNLTGSTQNSELELDLHSEYEVIKLRTFKIIVTSTLGNQRKVNILSGIKLKCKK